MVNVDGMSHVEYKGKLYFIRDTVKVNLLQTLLSSPKDRHLDVLLMQNSELALTAEGHVMKCRSTNKDLAQDLINLGKSLQTN